MKPLPLWRAIALVATLIALGVTGPAPAQQTAPSVSPSDKAEPAENAGQAPSETAKAPGEPAAEAAQKKGAKGVHGAFETGFDGLWSDKDSDMNLDQSLRIRIDPVKHERIHLRGSLWMHEDLDSDEPGTSALRDINDAFRSDVRARLLYLYLDIDDLWKDSTLRLGRQRIVEGAAFNRMDGVYFKQRRTRWDWYLFGGARATIYGDAHDDLVLGGGTSFTPFAQTRLALDLYYGEEERAKRSRVSPGPLVDLLDLRYPRRVEGELDETDVALSVWQSLTPNVHLFARYDWRNDAGDEALLNLTGFYPCWNLTYEVAYRHQFGETNDEVNDLTGFYRILGTHEEYDDFLVALHKPLSKKFVLSVEGEVHNADDDNWETGNRDYERYAIVLSADELAKGLDASAALERWNVHGDEGTWAVTGEVSKSWQAWKFTLGADYERYEDRLVKYNSTLLALDQLRLALDPSAYPWNNPVVFFLGQWIVESHENIHSVYGKAKWAFRENQDMTLGITYEEDDGPDSPYWRAQAEYSLRF